jgi:hypothetical protein
LEKGCAQKKKEGKKKMARFCNSLHVQWPASIGMKIYKNNTAIYKYCNYTK